MSGGTADENVEIVRMAYEVSYAQRSVDVLRQHFPDDFVFHMRPEFPGRSEYGVDDMSQLWADLDETFTEYQLTPADFTVHGDYVVVAIDQSALLRASEMRVQETIYHLWHVVDGQPREAWAYTERQEALEAVGAREQAAGGG